MIKRSFPTLLAVAAAAWLAGCSDPADKVHKSSAAAPQDAGATPAAAGKDYVIRAESKIGFVGSKVTGSHTGGFTNFAGNLTVADGRIENVGSLPISGNRLWVYADGGDQFFYAHMASFAPAAVNGRHVEKGTILGYVGNTGDAEPTPPHLHFEIHPNGGDAVDPNPFLVAWQKRAGASLADTAERPGALVEVRDFIGEG